MMGWLYYVKFQSVGVEMRELTTIFGGTEDLVSAVCGSKGPSLRKTTNAQDVQFSVHCGCLAHFSYNATQLPLKIYCLSRKLRFSL
jgi:hypothetical protein